MTQTRRAPRNLASMALLAISLLATSASCARDSYLVITLLSGDTAFTDVAAVEVTVNAPSHGSTTLTPDYDATHYPTFDGHTGPRLSVAFTPSGIEPVDVVVTVKDSTNPCVGRGVASGVLLKKGDTTLIAVTIFHVVGMCPGAGGLSDAGTDGAVPEARVTFPGCDPAVADTCPAAQTCFIDCNGKAASCVAAGVHGPGESCSGNADCAPGSACFDFSAIAGCAATTKLCMKFCARDSDCASTLDGSAPTDTTTPAGAGGTGMPATMGASETSPPRARRSRIPAARATRRFSAKTASSRHIAAVASRATRAVMAGPDVQAGCSARCSRTTPAATTPTAGVEAPRRPASTAPHASRRPLAPRGSSATRPVRPTFAARSAEWTRRTTVAESPAPPSARTPHSACASRF